MAVETKWKPSYVLRAYELAKSGYSDVKIAKILGVCRTTFAKWLESKGYLRVALKEGRRKIPRKNAKGNDPGWSLSDYLFDRLSAEAQKIWKELDRLDSDGLATSDDINAMFAGRGLRMRKQIALYAWTNSNFSITAAMKKVGISRKIWEDWKKDKEFRKLVEEIDWHKKNFFEDGLCQLVAEGNTSATIFANKTVNADRGYGQKLSIDVSGTVTHQLVSVADLDLPLEVRKQILDAVREKNALNGQTLDNLPVLPPVGRKQVESVVVS